MCNTLTLLCDRPLQFIARKALEQTPVEDPEFELFTLKYCMLNDYVPGPRGLDKN